MTNYPQFRAPGAPVDPNSSAAKIAARFAKPEPELDKNMLKSSEEHRREALTAALRARGLQPHVDASALQRVLARAPHGDPAEVANAIVEEVPGWFAPKAVPTSSELVRRFRAGETPIKPGS